MSWSRAIKTMFFLISMVVSLILVSAPVLLVVVDSILPCALLSTLTPISFQTLETLLKNYDFGSSLIDLPIISIARSLVIITVYSVCDGPALSHGPYLGTATVCSLLSVTVVSLKAFLFGGSFEGEATSKAVVYHDQRHRKLILAQDYWGMALMFSISVGLAFGHIMVAYRTSCKERRKLLFHSVDVEAIFASKNGFLAYHKK